MLKLERLKHSNGQVVAVTFAKKQRIFDRPLQRAIVYSLLFHGLLFGVFRIKFLDVYEPLQELSPVEVALDKEEIERPLQETLVVSVPEERWQVPYDAIVTALPKPELNVFEEEKKLLFEKTNHSFRAVHIPTISEITSLGVEELPLYEPVYPLHLHLSKNLSPCKLIDDGSSLFKNKTDIETVPFKLATTIHTITYDVTISGKSGSIIRWDRTKALLDKRLQECADLLLQKLRFQAVGDEEYIGTIALRFAVDGEEIRRYLK